VFNTTITVCKYSTAGSENFKFFRLS